MPIPTEHGWVMIEAKLQIHWMSMPIAPDSVLSFANCGSKTGCITNRCSCKKAGLKCTDLCKCLDNCENHDKLETAPNDIDDIDYDLAMQGDVPDSDSENESDDEESNDEESDDQDSIESEWESSTEVFSSS